MENLLDRHQDVFAKDSSELGLTTLVEHKIETGNAVPVKQLPRRLSNSLRTVEEDQVEEMLENNIIKPSNSPWSSPIVLVRKKYETWRFCIDFRKLNDVTVKDAFPMDNVASHQYFSTLDLASGYWQVAVSESSQKKTAFVIPGGGHFEFLRMPFGLTNAGPTFQRLMLAVLNGLLPLKCLVYLDDVLVVGRTFDQHYADLDRGCGRQRRRKNGVAYPYMGIARHFHVVFDVHVLDLNLSIVRIWTKSCRLSKELV